MPSTITCDLAIVGGGLAGSLIALALTAKRPELDVRIVESAATIGGNHLWSFFSADVATKHRWIVAPLISHRWSGYDVAFPAHGRTFQMPYYSIASARLDEVVRRELPEKALLMGRRVTAAGPRTVALDDGDRIEARGVIDARGPGDLGLLDLGWQKFVGREYLLSRPHDDPQPMVMDATVTQYDGYRFVYCLPFAATRMFVEDTYYSDGPELDVPGLRARADAYVAARGWQVDGVGHEETGVLPVVMDGDFDAYWRSGGTEIAKAGMRAGLFHPTTGYSLPDAVRTAALIAETSDLSGGALHDLTYGHARRLWRGRGFYRMLDTMLFKAAEPGERYKILERFYRLDPRLIGRFYAGRSTMLDKLRVLTGKPPVPLGRAITAIRGK